MDKPGYMVRMAQDTKVVGMGFFVGAIVGAGSPGVPVRFSASVALAGVMLYIWANGRMGE